MSTSSNLNRVIALSRLRAQEGHLPFWQQCAEMLALQLLEGIGPGFYHEAGMWDRAMRFKDKRRYRLGERYRRVVARVNPSAYYKLSQHKLAEKSLLNILNIPTPHYLGVYSRHWGRTADGASLRSEKDLLALLSNSRHQRVCFKRLEGSGGKGFIAAEILSSDEVAEMWDEPARDKSSFLRDVVLAHTGSEFVIESYLEQHQIMAQLNPTSVNTIRVWVREDDEDVSAVGALVRIGAAGKLTDNTSSGGLCATVDLSNGTIGAARFLDGRHIYHTKHPGHGSDIQGVTIPHWQDALALACETVRCFPMIKFSGLDVAIGTEGPCIIELNVEPDPIHAAVIGKPTLDLLGVA